MGYDEMRSIGGAIGLVGLFVGFVGVIVYAMWPGNKKNFDRAAMVPLDDDTPADEGRSK
ncbi:cbb3-type cytochrome c oxidase subunit 3 [Pyruvatibacter sp.]|uniref:cbb3-type cytochrome oxidase subunit 3 n=1 Tax=Pyruvatibacter sp. TaxID=1981328 RepID=UPI0032EE188E